MKHQDKVAEMEASGTTLNRFDSSVWNAHLPYKTRSLEMAGLSHISEKTILDFGCGPGTFGVILGLRNRLIGVDIAIQALREAIGRADSYHSDFQAVRVDGEVLCFRPASFDIVFSGWALHHLPEIEPIITAFAQLLKPGGLLVIIEPNEGALVQKISRFIENHLNRQILEAGLDTPNRTTHTREEYVATVERSGFTILNTFSWYNGEGPELPKDIRGLRRLALLFLTNARRALFWLSNSISGAGPEMYLQAQRGTVQGHGTSSD
jgi:SAM-dependent methyltransferase